MSVIDDLKSLEPSTAAWLVKLNMRTRKKILTNPKHPRHAAAVRAVHKASANQLDC